MIHFESTCDLIDHLTDNTCSNIRWSDLLRSSNLIILWINWDQIHSIELRRNPYVFIQRHNDQLKELKYGISYLILSVQIGISDIIIVLTSIKFRQEILFLTNVMMGFRIDSRRNLHEVIMETWCLNKINSNTIFRFRLLTCHIEISDIITTSSSMKMKWYEEDICPFHFRQHFFNYIWYSISFLIYEKS